MTIGVGAVVAGAAGLDGSPSSTSPSALDVGRFSLDGSASLEPQLSGSSSLRWRRAARDLRAVEVDLLQPRRIGDVDGERPQQLVEDLGRRDVGAGSVVRRVAGSRVVRRSRPGGPRCAARYPVASATRGRTASITARTSAAEPPSAAWMKLACFSDTQAVPMRSPRSPSPSMSARR